MKKHPPYGRKLPEFKDKSQAVICTGSMCWQRAKGHWMPNTPKLVLPFGESPGRYNWHCVKGRYCLITADGDPTTPDILKELSILLIQSGAFKVLWMMPSLPKNLFRGVTAHG